MTISHKLMTVPVALGQRSYDILIGPGLIANAGELIAPILTRPKLAIVTDENVARYHLDPLQAALATTNIECACIVLPAGESTKSYRYFAELCDKLLAAGIERNDMVAALGGGVIGDLAGFAAAALRRGTDFIQLPTSLLAQVDSSVGGKTGINSPLGKNLVGAFHQPRLVLADTDVLDSLPTREFRAGYAEIVKYGLLGDRDLFSWLDQHMPEIIAGDETARMTAISKSCKAKAAIVAQDERESGVRALLNLGHTFGHALEAATGYSGLLLHGEGVAIGMAMAFRFSERLGVCRQGCAREITAHLEKAGLPTSVRHLLNDLPGPEALLEIMRQDKKALAGKLTFILVRDVGEAYICRDVSERDVLAFLTSELGAS